MSEVAHTGQFRRFDGPRLLRYMPISVASLPAVYVLPRGRLAREIYVCNFVVRSYRMVSCVLQSIYCRGGKLRTELCRSKFRGLRATA